MTGKPAADFLVLQRQRFQALVASALFQSDLLDLLAERLDFLGIGRRARLICSGLASFDLQIQAVSHFLDLGLGCLLYTSRCV